MLADMNVDPAVGDNFDVVVGEQHINQDTIILRGVLDPQMRKNVDRSLARRLVTE